MNKSSLEPIDAVVTCDSELLKRLQEYQRFFELTPDVICSIDAQGRFIKVNTASEKLWGYKPEELVGTCCFDMIVEEDKSFTISVTQNIINGSCINHFENRYIHKDGRNIWVSWSVFLDKEEQVIHGIARDVSWRNHAFEELHDQKEQLKRACQVARLGIWGIDLTNNQKYSSEELFLLYGVEKGTRTFISHEEFFSLVHPEDLLQLQQNLNQLQNLSSHTFEHRLIRQDNGDTIFLQHNVQVIRDRDQKVIYVHGATEDITEKKKQELELKISNERFEFVSKATSDAIWDCDVAKRTTYYNEAFTHLFGHPHKEQQSAEIWDINLHPDDQEKMVNDVNKAINDPSVSLLKSDYRFKRADGSFAYVNDRALIIRDETGKGVRIVGSMQDITRQKEAELKLEKSEKRFRAMVQTGQDLIALMDQSFNVNYISPNYAQITGYSLNAVEGSLWRSFIHPDDYEAISLEAKNIFSQKTVTLPHFRYKMKDGSYKWFETIISNFLDDEDIRSIVTNTRDVTKRKNALDEVMKLSTVVQETSNSVIITDKEGLITWVNKAFIKRTEYTLGEAIGKLPQDLLHGPETCLETRQYIKRCLQNLQPFSCELLNYTKSGKKQWVEIKGQAIVDEKGILKHFFSIQTDITSRKEAEEAIRVSEERYKLLFFKSPSPKWIFNAQTLRIIEVNEAACQLYGYSRDEFLELTIPDLKIESERHLLAHEIQNTLLYKNQPFYDIMRHIKKNGEIFQVEINAHGIKLLTGYHVIVTGYDMTERLALQNKIVEEQITAQREVTRAVIQTQEKERGIISKELHDNVNQILTAAKLCIENTRYYPGQRDVFTSRGITMIQNAIKEIRNLSKALVSPAVYESGLKVNMLEMLDQYRNLQRFDIEEDLEFEEDDIDNELKLTIYRIVQELMNNTVKYAGATKVNVCIEQQGKTLTVVTQDNGKGFDVKSKSDGLGLANIKSRVDLFNGTVKIESSEGNGCKTLIEFPL